MSKLGVQRPKPVKRLAFSPIGLVVVLDFLATNRSEEDDEQENEQPIPAPFPIVLVSVLDFWTTIRSEDDDEDDHDQPIPAPFPNRPRSGGAE
jgi:hypothetical protein